MKYKGKKVQNWIHGMALELRDKKEKKKKKKTITMADFPIPPTKVFKDKRKKKRSQKKIELNKKLSRGEDHE